MDQDQRTMIIGVAAGTVLTCALIVLGGALESIHTLYSPVLFAPPATIGFVLAKRLRWIGGVYLALVIAAAYIAAFVAAMYIFGAFSPNLCVFCDATQRAAALPRTILAEAGAGAGAAALGTLISFGGLALLAADLRDKRARALMLRSAIALIVIGAVTLPISFEVNILQVLNAAILFVPWQIVFGWSLIALLRGHVPSVRKAALPTH